MPDRVDEFESIFKRAAKTRFRYHPPDIRTALLVTDREAGASAALLERVHRFLAVLDPPRIRWEVLDAGSYNRKSQLVGRVEELGPELVVTSRNLKQADKDTPHSLGAYLDTLTQATPPPVLVLPDQRYHDRPGCMEDTTAVMVATEHLTADHRLINYGVRLTAPGGDLHLCHVEDEGVFRRYMAAIERIPSIVTRDAEQRIREQLLSEPADYIQSCIEVLRDHGITCTPHAHVQMGRALTAYRQLIESCEADLLVLNTKDEDQMAMHGLAYAIAVEFRSYPLLML